MTPIALAALRGAAAGLLGGTVQVMVGAAESALILPEHEDANVAPRLMDRLARSVDKELPMSAEWVLGTLFHYGYGAVWGTLYGVLDEKTKVHPLAGGLALGGLIYAVTFPQWGVAVQTRAERPPHARTRRMTAVAASVALTFGLTTAYAAQTLRRRAPALLPV